MRPATEEKRSGEGPSLWGVGVTLGRWRLVPATVIMCCELVLESGALCLLWEVNCGGIPEDKATGMNGHALGPRTSSAVWTVSLFSVWPCAHSASLLLGQSMLTQVPGHLLARFSSAGLPPLLPSSFPLSFLHQVASCQGILSPW